MTKTLRPRTPSDPRTLLTRILDQPDLIGAVQSLSPASLLRLIEHVGLEDADRTNRLNRATSARARLSRRAVAFWPTPRLAES